GRTRRVQTWRGRWSARDIPPMVTVFVCVRPAVGTAGTAARGALTGWTAILRGAFPTGMVAVTARVERSTTETSLDPSLATHAVRPSGAMAIQCGSVPTGTVATTLLLAVSTMASSPGPCTATSAQRPSGVDGERCGEAPTGTCATTLVVAVFSTCTALMPARVK